MTSLNERLIAYCQWRAKVCGYRYSGKAAWEAIRRNQPIRGAVTCNAYDQTLHDAQFPLLLLHYREHGANPR